VSGNKLYIFIYLLLQIPQSTLNNTQCPPAFELK